MPIYDYQCQNCFQVVEVLQTLSEPPMENCPFCGGRVKKLANGNVGLVFKGSGFYITDYKKRAFSSNDESPSSTSTSPPKPTEKDETIASSSSNKDKPPLGD
ncbi:MAG: FmdB family zinc ribbon protein [bacterium]